MLRRYLLLIAMAVITLVSACGINSVTRTELESVKAGDVLVYRYQKDGKSWFYADKITRIEGEEIYYNASEKEGTAGNDDRIKNFDTKRELSTTKGDLVKYETEQGDDRKVIIWINP